MTARYRTATGLRRKTASAAKPASRVSHRAADGHGAPNPNPMSHPTAVLVTTALRTRATAATADAYG